MSRVRLAALLSALSLAGDLGHGRPLEHTLRATYLAVRLAGHVGLDEATVRDVLYIGLLQSVGCVGNARELADFLRTDDIAFKADIAGANYRSLSEQLRVVARHAGSTGPLALRPVAVVRAMTGPDRPRIAARAQCEVAALIARRVGLGVTVDAGLRAMPERWDGAGLPDGLRGEAIPLTSRLVYLGAGIDIFVNESDASSATAEVAALSGTAFDPTLAHAFGDLVAERPPWATIDSPELWDEVLALEPASEQIFVDDNSLDDVALAFADFADIKSPFFVGHSRGVAEIAHTAARRLHLSEAEATDVRRAALLHDIGRASVPNSILDKPRGLTPGERERVRMHAYYTERVLQRAPAFASCAMVAGAHHERLDGSGYPRGSRAVDLAIGSRILAAADVAQALKEARPYRLAYPADRAASILREEARTGRLDGEVVETVLAVASGDRPARVRATGALSERELEVVRLLAGGHANKEISRRLAISENTVRHHLESVYAKLDARTRTGAVMQALARGLL
ncbi:MAG: HD domain-containing phosphohydrolase [Candidatus Limnocylindria bacterium]